MARLQSVFLRICAVLITAQYPAPAQTVSPADAARFLEQSTFGPTAGTVSRVQSIGYEGFLEEQFNTPRSTYPDLPLMPTTRPAECTGTCVRDNYSMYPLQVAFYGNALGANDQLRQRVAFALHQIFVVSALEISQPSWMGPYLEILGRNAFGNFRQLIEEVTLSPAMGRYLDMAGNNKSNPNENYAREALQLFTIGLDKLNPDGTPQLSTTGERIPAFTEADVVTFSRLFTGWNLAAGASGIPNYKSQMVANNGAHDTTAKALLNGVTTPVNLTAAQDLAAGLDNLFQHPNVGPFLGKQLIQHLVTSNPTPAYVARVAAAFNNNGAGVRGDLKAVVRAILLDPEARQNSVSASFGHLREPVLFVTTLLRQFETTAATTDFVLGDSYLPTDLRMGQDLFRSPSVFNYYSPFYRINSEQLTGPEFGIYSTSTAMARMNFAGDVIYKRMTTSTDRPKGTWLDLSPIAWYAPTPDLIVQEVNRRMLHGSMSTEMRTLILNAVTAMPSSDFTGRLRRAIYLVATSAEYSVGR